MKRILLLLLTLLTTACVPLPDAIELPPQENGSCRPSSTIRTTRPSYVMPTAVREALLL